MATSSDGIALSTFVSSDHVQPVLHSMEVTIETVHPNAPPPSSTIASASQSTATPRKAQPISQGSFFHLPLELRRMVYKHLVPLPKTITPSGRYRKPKRGYGPKQLEVHIRDKRRIRPPVLTQVCIETRAFMLESGSFIFTKAENDGGLWWNSKEDILFFDDNFVVRFQQYIFEGLGGLHRIQNLALDTKLSIHVAFNIQYKSAAEIFKPIEAREFSAVKLCFLTRSDDDESESWLTRYFPRATYFEVFVDFECPVIFDLCHDKETEVRDNLIQLSRLWGHVTFVEYASACLYPRLLETHGSSLDYFKEPGREISDNLQDWGMCDCWDFASHEYGYM